MDDVDVELAGRIAVGDRDALGAFYERTFDLLFREAARATGRDESFCLDVVQDAFLRLVRRPPRVDGAAALHAWLRRVVVSAACDRLRAEARRMERERRSAAACPRAAERDAVEAGERLARLRRERARLDETADLPVLRHRAGSTLGSLGALFGLSGSAVDGRITRALARLRRRLDDEETDDAS